MPNKHGAGCTCCQEDCSTCNRFITSVAVTINSETVSWPVNQFMHTLAGCTLLLRHCSDPVIYDLLDYSAVTAYDGRNGDCWKPFADIGQDAHYVQPLWPQRCCLAESGGGPAPMSPGGGPGPVTPTGCIVCGTAYKQEPSEEFPDVDWPCQMTEYYITTFKVHDVTADIKVKVWHEYSVSIRFIPPLAMAFDVSKVTMVDVQHKVSFSITGYYNDNCPRDYECTVAAADCTEPVSGVYPDQVLGSFYCENGFHGQDGLRQYRFFDCATDTPNWVEATTSTYCFDSYMQEAGTWQEGCTKMLTICSGGPIKLIGGRLAVVTSDQDWETARPGDPTCFLINPKDKLWEDVNQLGDWIEFNLFRRDTNRFNTFPFDRLMSGTYPDQQCDIRDPMDPRPTICLSGCGTHNVGSARWAYEGAGDYDGEANWTCTGSYSVCSPHPVPLVEYPPTATGDVEDIIFDFSTCPVSQCTTGDDAVVPACGLWLSSCCEGTDPATVTIPTGWNVPFLVSVTINCT